MITQIGLKNFTAFRDLAIDLSPKINVIIGENGTGKTHLLKVAYGLCMGYTLLKSISAAGKKAIEKALTAKLLRLFMPLDNKLGKLRHHGVSDNAQLDACFASDRKVVATFQAQSRTLTIQESANFEQYQAVPVFIPTKEVLSLVQGMNHEEHDQKTVDRIFDDSYIDLSGLLKRKGHDDPQTKIDLDPRFGSIVPKLVKLIGGRYYWEKGGFCFQRGSYKEKPDPERSKSKHAQVYQDSMVTRFIPTADPVYSSSMTAEGYKKIGILHRLLINGSLNPGTSGPLFWDEPESNMNPKLMKPLVQILLELSRNGQQIVLATHDYVLLKWFDLLMDKGKADHVRFHALYRDIESGDVRVESTNDYNLIRKSAISDAFAELYDEDVKRALG